MARLAHATETFAKTRGGISQTDLTRLAQRGLISEAGREAIGYSATILNYQQPRDITTAHLLDAADTPAALAKIAAAVACGLAETAIYRSLSSQPCRAYLDTLTASGWTPDTWTATPSPKRRDLSDGTNPNGGGDRDDELEPALAG